MPVYESVCRKCGKVHDYIRPVSGYMDTPDCCGEKTQKVILSAPMGYVENIHYTSPIDGRPITTKQARIEDLRRSGSRPWEGIEQETKVARQRAAEEEKAQDKARQKPTPHFQQRNGGFWKLPFKATLT
jgi:hypothetical protein